MMVRINDSNHLYLLLYFLLYKDYDGASTSEALDESDREKMLDPMCETDEGADGVSSEGEKANAETTEVCLIVIIIIEHLIYDLI